MNKRKIVGRAKALTVLGCYSSLLCEHNAPSIILIPMSDFVSHAPFTKCHLPYSQLTDKMTLARHVNHAFQF